MKLFRKVIFWCHLTAGVFAGTVVLIMSVTGVLLAYERQITYWANTRSYRVAIPSPGAAALPVETLLARVREVRPASPSALTQRAEKSAPAEVSFGREDTLFVNPYTGEVLGGGSQRVRSFFRAVMNWHRWLGASGEGQGRSLGKAIAGACNLAFLFIVTSGFFLWWPRKWTRQSVRSVMWFRRGLAGRARDFNWHNTVGFWSAMPLFIIVLSAVVISYTWASNLVYRAAGETPPAPRGAQGAAAGSDDGAPVESPPGGLDRMWARVERQVSGWQSISLQIPTRADALVTFTIDQGNGGQPQQRGQLSFDRKTGEVVRWEPFTSYTRGRRIRSLLRFAHTGEVVGVVGQTIATIASTGGAILALTGLALAWRRFRAWVVRRLGRSGDAATSLAEGTMELRENSTDSLDLTAQF